MELSANDRPLREFFKSSQGVKLFPVISKFNGIVSSVTSECSHKETGQLHSFPRGVIVKPTTHYSRINSISPRKFRKLGSVGRVVHIHQEMPPTRGKKKMKKKKHTNRTQ